MKLPMMKWRRSCRALIEIPLELASRTSLTLKFYLEYDFQHLVWEDKSLTEHIPLLLEGTQTF